MTTTENETTQDLTTPPVRELDPASIDLVNHYLTIREEYLARDHELEEIKELLRDRLGYGVFAANGHEVIEIGPRMWFSEEKAREELPPSLISMIETKVLDRKLARKLLRREVYRRCLTEQGKPIVRPVLKQV
jgi:hypothetical protein